MNASMCHVCNVIFEDDETSISHRCWITTDEYSDEYGILERNMLPRPFENQVSSAGAIASTHIGTRFAMRNDPFQIGKEQNATEISEKISKHPSESFENPDFFNALCELDPIFDSMSKQQSAIEECRSEQIISRSEQPLPSIAVPFPHDQNFYKFPAAPTYSVQDRLEDIIQKYTSSVPDKISNFDVTYSASFKNISESRTNNLNRNILPVLPNNTMCASNTTHDDRSKRDSINLQTFTKASFSKNASFEEKERNPKKIKSTEGKTFKCELCDKTFIHYIALDAHNIIQHKIKPNFQCKKCSRLFTLEEHCDIHMLPNDKKCQICCWEFWKKSELLYHLRFVHNLEGNFKCDLCGIWFSSKNVLEIHMEAHVKQNRKSIDFRHK
ncbi:hypothetical protein NPIL_15891 [Nephila pilipes]|uniref:C2H2-type domain-containing protein n=1 Tax=Nephila pilipes TaxID=299642 RepID=A0A8X6KB24_NEPPI|nr:hypothetical protein NPIL_15891 [Nephila pilipes]